MFHLKCGRSASSKSPSSSSSIMAVNLTQTVPYSIFHASNDCRRSFEHCLAIKGLTNNDWAENRLAEFNLWASSVGASVKQRASLDTRLASEPEVRAVVTSLLITLDAFIRECRELGRLIMIQQSRVLV